MAFSAKALHKHKLSAGEGASPPLQTPPPFDHARILLTHYPVSEVNAQPKYTVFNAAVTDIKQLRKVQAHGKVGIRFAAMLWFEIGQ